MLLACLNIPHYLLGYILTAGQDSIPIPTRTRFCLSYGAPPVSLKRITTARHHKLA